MDSVRTIEHLSSALAAGGAKAALAYLNEGVPHRYTAVYRLQGRVLRNVLLHDKQGEVRPEFLTEVPFEHSFCQFVLREGVFRTTDSAGDSRLDGHPYQGVMVSYHGVPLIAGRGELIGTVCHFDVVPHDLPDNEFELLERAGHALPPYLPAAEGR